MKQNIFLQFFLVCAVVLASGLAARPANALSYASFFDPPDFEGTAIFDVSAGCLAADGYRYNNDPNTGCIVTWSAASVTLKDNAPVSNTTFSYDPFFLPSTTAVNFIFVQKGDLAGVNSNMIGPRIISHPNPDFTGPWWIQYDFPDPPVTILTHQPSIQNHQADHGALGLGIVNLFGGACFNLGSGQVCQADTANPSTANVEFFRRISQVPEPATLGLMLGALGGAWLARRRRKKPA